ncbi:radical SAM domain protein [Paramagnetospirillum magnetotacticum MS-1]|uniref:Radical SAM domain protein n=1 Tax=Paramagnetospirillum magnetotacticum MS-1 TaxID=272627 RepID=A0A0C2YHK8_PARME|nr:radical SAM protein [Paramagnetospirillum magnetotacticum]KIL99204.1 radical SAM domain protein [Paramagnetospirillum magnetotacticum MS-1]
MTAKRRVYFNEFNLLMGNTTYLPLVSGLLKAYALTRPALVDSYEFMPFHFHIEAPGPIVDRHQDPFVAAFSLSLWNEQLSLDVARKVKARFPQCVIVMGGAQVPHRPESFFAAHPFLDVAVRGEGEEAFADILERLAEGRRDMDGLPGISWRTPEGEVRIDHSERPFQRDLDAYPSPYLTGLFDDLFVNHPDKNFQAIIETNRGCPFHCTFCYWGKGGLSRKYRYTSLERTFGEIEWMAAHGIRYLFNADSNFGMHRRDIEIAQKIVETKQAKGFPEAFRSCYGKNTDEKILEIGRLLHKHGLEKGITISYQSISPEVQKNIKRDNIKLSVAEGLQRAFNEAGVPVYTELILALPGETAESWVKGIDTVLEAGLKNQLYLYICQVLPNTELADPDYMAQFGIRTHRVKALPVHGSVTDPDWVTEFEEILISTNTMSVEDWRRMLAFSWAVMLLFSLKAGFFVMLWLSARLGVSYSAFPLWLADRSYDGGRTPLFADIIAGFWAKTDDLLAGGGRGTEVEGTGGIYWEEEEAAWLKLAKDPARGFAEMGELLAEFLSGRGVAFDPEELAEVVRYQSLAVPTLNTVTTGGAHDFVFNLPQWFEHFFDAARPALERSGGRLKVEPVDYAGDLPRLAREVLLWGRKSGRLLNQTGV